MRKPIYPLLALVLIVSAIALAEDHPTTKPIGADLVANGGFENGGEGWPFAPNGANCSGEVTAEAAHSGKHSYKITNKSGFALNVYGRTFQIVGGLDPYTTYRISCYAKGKNVGICWIGGGPGWFHRKRVPEGTYDWTYVETLWTTGATGGDFELMVCTESQTQALYIDDVKMEPIHADTAKRDAALAKFQEQISTQTRHYDDLQAKLLAHPQAGSDQTIKLGMYVARRFLDRILDTHIKQSWTWSSAQLDEINQVLDETNEEIDRFIAEKRTASPQIRAGGIAPVRIRDGIFYTETTEGQNRPWFFYGYGHFGQLYRELSNWPTLGVSIIQDGRCGPSSMNEDGSLREGARRMLADIERAELAGIKVDYLLSPHYFPEWAWKNASADLREGGLGFLYFNIDHPAARDAIGRWADKISAALKDHKNLFSVCLSNEPVYQAGGRNPQTLPLYQKYLEELHHKIETLNDLYGTSYKSFADIKPPPIGLSKDVKKNRAYYDWCRFNQKHFADWHAWLRSIVRKNLPDVPTHAKIMVFQSMDRDKLFYGVDPEAFCDVTEIAGCDAYAFPAGAETYDWQGHEFWYDLLNSFHNQPVFNSENHIIPDGTGPVHFPSTMTRAQIWQDALHHQAVTTIWVWEELVDPSLAGSIFFRPNNVYGAGRAMLDLARFAPEVAAINTAPPDVAILYSQPSIFWEENYKGTCFGIHAHLNCLGLKTTFVSEKMLAENRVPKVKWIVVPQATHVEDATVEGLEKFVSSGGHLLLIGENNLAFNPYHIQREVPKDLLDRATEFSFAKEAPESHAKLSEIFAPKYPLLDTSGKPAWDVEYHTVEESYRTLIPIINFNREKITVSFPTLHNKRVIDLLSGEKVDLSKLELAPMVPHLLSVQ